MWTEEGGQKRDFLGRHKWMAIMAPYMEEGLRGSDDTDEQGGSHKTTKPDQSSGIPSKSAAPGKNVHFFRQNFPFLVLDRGFEFLCCLP